jgi:hypothetical protein
MAIINGTNGDDNLEGHAGDDDITGGEGNDVLDGGAGINILNGGEGDERWSQDFGPVVKVDQLVKEVIPNDETKEPFTRFQSQGCA